MFYRPYHPDDFAQLYAVEEICFQPPLRFTRTYMRQLVGSRNAATWMAEENGLIAGFAIVEWSSGSNETTAYIQTIEVLPEFRRMGVAAELMRRLEDSASNAGAILMWLHVDAENAAAQRLYEAHDYTQKGREENYYPRGRAALIYMKQFELAPKPSKTLIGVK
jgi:ribosomal-protein-alanine N-acetyltransferase